MSTVLSPDDNLQAGDLSVYAVNRVGASITRAMTMVRPAPRAKPPYSRLQVLSSQDGLHGLLGMAFRVLLHALSCNQSTAVIANMFATQRSLVTKVRGGGQSCNGAIWVACLFPSPSTQRDEVPKCCSWKTITETTRAVICFLAACF